MYNRYIPQSDGSYRRSSTPDQQRQNPQRQQKPRPPAPPQRPESPCERPKEPPKPTPPPCQPERPQTGIGDFLKNLLPREIDTADLLIILLLLLMDREDECGLSPLLTLALYFLL